MFDKIHDLIRKNDVTAYDAYRSALSKDANLNKEYQDYMQMLVDNREKYNVPLVSDDYLATHAPKPVSDIAAEITAEAKLSNVSVKKTNHSSFIHLHYKEHIQVRLQKENMKTGNQLHKT